MTTDSDQPAVVTRHRWCLGARLLVACSLGWFVLVVLHWACTGRVWLWLLLDALPPIAYVGVPAVLLAALALALLLLPPLAHRSLPRSAALTTGAVVVLSLVLGLGSSGLNLQVLAGPPARAAAADTIHVMSWNTEYWDTTDDPDAFYRYLASSHADVYLLQEYLGRVNDHFLRIDDSEQLRRWFPGYQRYEIGELVTLSRYPILSVRPLPADPAPGTPWETVLDTAKVLRTDLQVGDHRISVYNVHVSVQLDGGGALTPRFFQGVRRQAAKRQTQYRTLAADIATNSMPTLVAGDFNTSPAMGELRRLRGRMQDAITVNESLYPVSWSVGGHRLWRLDWAFVGHGLKPISYRFRDPAGLSDHLAQDLRLSLPASDRSAGSR